MIFSNNTGGKIEQWIVPGDNYSSHTLPVPFSSVNWFVLYGAFWIKVNANPGTATTGSNFGVNIKPTSASTYEISGRYSFASTQERMLVFGY